MTRTTKYIANFTNRITNIWIRYDSEMASFIIRLGLTFHTNATVDVSSEYPNVNRNHDLCMSANITMNVLNQKGSQTRARVSVAFSNVGVKLPRIKRASSGFRGQNGFRTRKCYITRFYLNSLNSKCFWYLLMWTWFFELKKKIFLSFEITNFCPIIIIKLT